MQPLVSVLIPAYGEAPFIVQTLTSVYSQSYSNFEILVLYSKPEPKTLSILQQFKIKSGRLEIFQLKESVNLGAALNIGLSHSNGSYISRIDSDDLMVYDRLQSQVDFLERHTEVVLVGGQKVHIDQANRIINVPPSHPKSSFFIKLLLRNGYCPIVHPSVMFRRHSALSAGGYSDELVYAEDYEFWTRLSVFGKFQNLKEVFVAYRIHDQNKSGKDPTDVSHLKEIMKTNVQATSYATSIIKKLTNVLLLSLYHSFELVIKKCLGNYVKILNKGNRELTLEKYLMQRKSFFS